MTSTEPNERFVVVPRWFLLFMGAMAALSAPWFGWATLRIASHDADVAVLKQQTEKIGAEAVLHRERVWEHLLNTSIHGGKVADLQVRIEALEKKLRPKD